MHYDFSADCYFCQQCVWTEHQYQKILKKTNTIANSSIIHTANGAQHGRAFSSGPKESISFSVQNN